MKTQAATTDHPAPVRTELMASKAAELYRAWVEAGRPRREDKHGVVD